MPICPHCNASIHAGAEDQCPACGYGMERADAIFGRNEVEFTRVVDSAGALTHRERMELIRVLEDLECDLLPVALCVYITDHGQTRDFRPHAHWILNHARIHHPSFGRREQRRAIEDAAMVEIRPGEYREREVEKRPGLLQRAVAYVRDAFRTCPPPARQEWMLMLVLDVQLELACFSWGYMLDPYVNADNITSSIVKARLKFRERAMVPAIKEVMRDAVRTIAAASHRTNNSLRASAGRKVARSVAVALGASVLLAQHAGMAAPTQFEDDDYAEPVEEDSTPATTPATPAAPATPATPAVVPAPQPAAPAVDKGAPASYFGPPRWSSRDFEYLMSAQINSAYGILVPQERRAGTAAGRTTPETGAYGESDTDVRGRYTEEYNPRPGRRVPDLNDPQKLLTDMERQDAAYVLNGLNAHSAFRVYVAVFKSGQDASRHFPVDALVASIARVDEYAVLLQYCTGDAPTLDIGYKSIELSNEKRMAILAEAQDCAVAAGGGNEGLMAAMRLVHSRIAPLSSGFTPLTAGTAYKLDHVKLSVPEEVKEEEEEEGDFKQWFAKQWETYGIPGVVILSVGLAALGLWAWRSYCKHFSSKLLDTKPDYRLGSPYGAGVSRYVKYLEGQEIAKEKQLF